MILTPTKFEKIMEMLDNDPTVDEKERSLILQKMRTSENFEEFMKFLESIAVEDPTI